MEKQYKNLTLEESARLEALRARIGTLSGNESAEFHNLAKRALAHLNFRRGMGENLSLDDYHTHVEKWGFFNLKKPFPHLSNNIPLHPD